jgi:hypothetical protein
MYQQNSPFQNAIPYLLLVVLVLVAFLIFKNNPAIMVPEPYFKTILKKKELASMSISFGLGENAEAQPSPDATDEAIARSASTPLRQVGHRWVELPAEEFQTSSLSSKEIEWQISNDRLVVLEKKKITALNLNGQVVWQLHCLPDTEFAKGGPTIQNNMVYAATTSGHVYALRMSDGELAWFYKSPVQFLFAPLVHAKKLLLFAANTNDKTWSLISLNAADGVFIFRSEPNDVWPEEMPVIYKYSLGITFKGGKFRLLNLETGATLWRAEAATNFLGQPYFFDDQVFLSDESGLLTIYDWESGQKINEVLLPSALNRSLQFVDATRSLIGVSVDGSLVAVDLKKRERIWHHGLGMGTLPIDAQLLRLSTQSLNQLQFASKVQGLTVWATCQSTSLCIYDLKGGLLLTRLDLKGRPLGVFRPVTVSAEVLHTADMVQESEASKGGSTEPSPAAAPPRVAGPAKPRIFVPLARGSQLSMSAFRPHQASSSAQRN